MHGDISSNMLLDRMVEYENKLVKWAFSTVSWRVWQLSGLNIQISWRDNRDVRVSWKVSQNIQISKDVSINIQPVRAHGVPFQEQGKEIFDKGENSSRRSWDIMSGEKKNQPTECMNQSLDQRKVLKIMIFTIPTGGNTHRYQRNNCPHDSFTLNKP